MDSLQRKVIAIRFLKFCLVGGVGALIQIGVFTLFTNVLKKVVTRIDTLSFLGYSIEIEYRFLVSLAIAIIVVTIWNFTGNLKWTFREKA